MKENGIKYKNRRNVPKVIQEQQKRQMSHLRSLVRGSCSSSMELDVVMDEESQFYSYGN